METDGSLITSSSFAGEKHKEKYQVLAAYSQPALNSSFLEVRKVEGSIMAPNIPSPGGTIGHKRERGKTQDPSKCYFW